MIEGICRGVQIPSPGDSLLAGAVVGAAAQRHADDAAGERHEQRVMIPIQLQAQDPPVLPPHVASRHTEKRESSEIRRFQSTTATDPAVKPTPCTETRRTAPAENKRRYRKKRACPPAAQGDAKHYNRPRSGWAGRSRGGEQDRSSEDRGGGRRRGEEGGGGRRREEGAGGGRRRQTGDRQRGRNINGKADGLTCWGCRRRCPPGAGC